MQKKFFLFTLVFLSQIGYTKDNSLKEIELEENDQVYVIKDISAEKQKYQDTHFGYVYIAGEVKKNGAIEYKENMTLSDAIITSEYFTPLRANQKKVIIKRGSRNIYQINMDLIFNLRNPEENIILKRGDTILVKRNIPAIISDKIRVIFLPIIDIFGSLTTAIVQASSTR